MTSWKASSAWLKLTAVILAAVIGPCTLVANSRPFSVEDLLAVEKLGAVDALSDGRVVFEKIGPIASGSNFGRFVPDALGWSRSKVLVAYPSGRVAEAFKQNAGFGYLIGARSPAGTRFAVIILELGRTRLGIFDASADSYAEIDISPDLSSYQKPIWIDERRVVLAVSPAERTWTHADPPDAQTRLPEFWSRQHDGEQATATVMRSGGPPSIAHQASGSLVVVDTVAGTSRVLGTGDHYDLSLSPNRRYVAAVKKARPLMPDPRRPIRFSHIEEWDTELVIYRLSGSDVLRPCPGCNSAFWSPTEWSPSGNCFLFVGSRESEHATKLFSFDTATRRTVEILVPGAKLVSSLDQVSPGRGIGAIEPRATWLGESVLVLARPETGRTKRRADWYLVDPANLGTRNMTADLADPPSQAWSAGAQSAMALTSAGIWRLSTETAPQPIAQGRSFQLVTPGAPYPDPPRVRAAAPDFVFRGGAKDDEIIVVSADSFSVSSFSVDADVSVLDASVGGGLVTSYVTDHQTVALGVTQPNGRHVGLLEFNEHLTDVQQAKSIRIDYKDKAGRKMYAWLLLPSDYKNAQRYPLIVDVYPNAIQPASWSGRRIIDVYYRNEQILASNGYAVLFPSIPLDPERLSSEPLNAITAPVLAAVDRAIDLGYADPDRLAVQGQSFGGYGVQAILTQTNRFKAAQSVAGWANMLSLYGTLLPDRRVLGPVDTLDFWIFGAVETGWINMGGPPWQYLDRYVRSSPIGIADKITTPLMLVQGDFDYIPIQQSEEMFSALYRQRKEAEYVRYWGEGHVIVSPANIRDYWARTLSWYGRHIGDPGQVEQRKRPKK